MVAYDKHDYFYLGIIITGSLLALLALLLTVIKPDFEKPTFIDRFIEYGRDRVKSARDFMRVFKRLKEAEQKIEDLKAENAGHIKEKNDLRKINDSLNDFVSGQSSDYDQLTKSFKESKDKIKDLQFENKLKDIKQENLKNDMRNLNKGTEIVDSAKEQINLPSPSFPPPPPPSPPAPPPKNPDYKLSPLRMLFN